MQMNVQVRGRAEALALIPLATLGEAPALAEMRILQRGNRLSITPVSDAEWELITANERILQPTLSHL